MLKDHTNSTAQAASNGIGAYSVGQLQHGHYTVTVERDGFRKYVQTGVVLTVNQAATLNVTLQTGDVTQTVSVTANAQLINAISAELSTVVNEHAILQLPLNGRDPSSPDLTRWICA